MRAQIDSSRGTVDPTLRPHATADDASAVVDAFAASVDVDALAALSDADVDRALAALTAVR